MKTDRMLAGAAQVDITPVMGTQIAGDIGRRRPVEAVLDPIFAKALVVESGGKKICVLSLDICVIGRKWADAIRRGAEQRFGFDQKAVMVHPVQNHAAPAMGHLFLPDDDAPCRYFPEKYPWLKGGDDAYNHFALERILEVIGQADKSCQPVSYGMASGLECRVAFNRRYIMRDGTAKTHPGYNNPNVLFCEGPIDPEVGVAAFKAESGLYIAMLLHHTCHPVHGFPLRYITAGWPGAWSTKVRVRQGLNCVPLVINGCCGNIHYNNPLNPFHDDDWHHLGGLLAEDTDAILAKIDYQAKGFVDYVSKTIRIPVRLPPPAEIRRMRQYMRKHPEPVWKKGMKGDAVERDWVYAASGLEVIDYFKSRPYFEYEIQAFRIGDILLAGLPGEVFVEGQLRIKLGSPRRYTFLAHICNTYAGYIPTREAFEHGGFETRFSNGSKLVTNALDIIVKETLKLLKDLGN
ncbi:hypothetical protein ACFLQL_03255 [Verrucomicrobiota bacterium]